jgi:hypothetical protein
MEDIVLKGVFLPKGMPNFAGQLNLQEVSDIKNYILHSAAELRSKKE